MLKLQGFTSQHPQGHEARGLDVYFKTLKAEACAWMLAGAIVP